MPDPSPGATRAHNALEASRQLVARRKGVPMVVSLRGARQAGTPVTGTADARLADLFETFHADLHPDGADDETALIETLQAVAYDRLLGGESGPHATAPAQPAPLPGDPAEPAPLPGHPAAIGRAATLADLRAGRFLRVMNYHNTPPGMRDELVAELTALARDYAVVTPDDLDRFMRTGRWDLDRPALLVAVYEGYRDNYDVAAAACEEAGVTGWFFVCTAFMDAPAERQYDFALDHRIKLVDENPRGERIAMTWDEVADLHRRGHVVTPHTASHELAERVVTEEDVRREVVEPKLLVDAATGGDAACTAWLAGTHWTGRGVADRALVDAGYRYLFANTMVQRLPDPRD
ncbi:polysaccharide deacetylase family protein [Streptomyces sp. BPPL-273]|uniref:Polysaccharide deacetylase family protein n=1 Tax=Streptomyces parvulus TaxID=146923 RepID=A0ABV5D849_9ACTN|nr:MULTISPECIES: polysaccharide deacetylase family protein [Streptomyces]WHM29971.1 polysaccharide deacetylase family protein [Streptomyces sp. BPPL-273]